VFGLLTKARRNAGFWLSAQLLFVLPNGVLSLCDAMVEGPLLAECCLSRRAEIGQKRTSQVAANWQKQAIKGGRLQMPLSAKG
jgi:hypothetical protein